MGNRLQRSHLRAGNLAEAVTTCAKPYQSAFSISSGSERIGARFARQLPAAFHGLRFRWRRIQHEVAHAEGPERIAMQWWRDPEGRPLTRDYFRIESHDGLRLWLFRNGLFGREIEPSEPPPRWYVHGLLA